MNIYVHIKEFFNIDLIPLYTHRDSFNPSLLLRFAKDRCDKKMSVRASASTVEGTKQFLKHPL